MRFALIPLFAMLLTACTPAPTPVSGLPFFGEGYRFKGDACRRLGESDLTQDYLDDAADLVACPEDLENLGVFVIDYQARELERTQGHVIYSVPVR